MSGPWEKYQQKPSGPWEKFQQTQSQVEDDQDGIMKEGSKLLVDTLARGADYAGGLARTGLGEAADAFVDGDKVTTDDWKKALVGKAPSSAELMDKLGVPKGKSLSDVIPQAYSATGTGLPLQKGGWADPTVRGAAGLATDIATDPLTYLTLGAEGLGKAGKALTLASDATEVGGKTMYKSGLKRIDQEVAKYGKEPVSDLLLKNNIAGSARAIFDKMNTMGEQLYEKQKALLKAADESGSKVSMQAAMQDSLNKIAEMRASKDPKLQAVADQLEAEAQSYMRLTPEVGTSEVVTPSQASGFKSSLYDIIPTGSFQEDLAKAAGVNPQLVSGRKDQARGLKVAIENTLGDKGPELAQINDELGRLLTSKEKQRLEGFKELNKNGFTSVDAMTLALKPKVTLFKKIADIAKMTGPRTYTGRALYNAGKGPVTGPLIDVLSRRALIDNAPDSIWNSVTDTPKK